MVGSTIHVIHARCGDTSIPGVMPWARVLTCTNLFSPSRRAIGSRRMGTWADRYAKVKRRSWSMQYADAFSTFHAELMVSRAGVVACPPYDQGETGACLLQTLDPYSGRNPRHAIGSRLCFARLSRWRSLPYMGGGRVRSVPEEGTCWLLLLRRHLSCP